MKFRGRLIKMYYVYILQSKRDQSLYIGITNNLKRRMQEHNNGQSKYTKSRYPYKLIYYEAFVNKKDAIRDEKLFKSGIGREVLKKKLKSTLSDVR